MTWCWTSTRIPKNVQSSSAGRSLTSKPIANSRKHLPTGSYTEGLKSLSTLAIDIIMARSRPYKDAASRISSRGSRKCGSTRKRLLRRLKRLLAAYCWSSSELHGNLSRSPQEPRLTRIIIILKMPGTLVPRGVVQLETPSWALCAVDN